MRKLILVLVALALIAAAIAVYFVATVPRSSPGVLLPLGEAHRDLLATVPADADAFALVPAAAAARAKLERNPVTREAVARWTENVWLPDPWMLGGADLLLWQSNGKTSYAFRLDALRSLIVRAWLTVSGADVHVSGSTVVIGMPPTTPLGRDALDPLLQLAAALPPGDALVFQRGGADGFPPVARPAASTVAMQPEQILIVSRAADPDPPAGAARPVALPNGSLLSAWFGEPPRLIRDVDRLVPGKLSTLLANGGSVVLYDVESRRLLPRPRGLFVIPATPESRDSARRISGLAELVGEVADRGDRILIALDDTSLGSYDSESLTPLPFPASEWALRIDAGKMVPALERLGDNAGLRFAAPRLYRSVRDLRGWIGHLRAAHQIEAALTASGGHEELRVRITSK